MSSSDIVVRKSAAMPAKVISHGSIVTYDTLRRAPRREGCPIVGLPCPLGTERRSILTNGYQ